MSLSLLYLSLYSLVDDSAATVLMSGVAVVFNLLRAILVGVHGGSCGTRGGSSGMRSSVGACWMEGTGCAERSFGGARLLFGGMTNWICFDVCYHNVCCASRCVRRNGAFCHVNQRQFAKIHLKQTPQARKAQITGVVIYQPKRGWCGRLPATN